MIQSCTITGSELLALGKTGARIFGMAQVTGHNGRWKVSYKTFDREAQAAIETKTPSGTEDSAQKNGSRGVAHVPARPLPVIQFVPALISADAGAVILSSASRDNSISASPRAVGKTDHLGRGDWLEGGAMVKASPDCAGMGGNARPGALAATCPHND